MTKCVQPECGQKVVECHLGRLRGSKRSRICANTITSQAGGGYSDWKQRARGSPQIVGNVRCRVWRLYLAGSAYYFLEALVGSISDLVTRPNPMGEFRALRNRNAP